MDKSLVSFLKAQDKLIEDPVSSITNIYVYINMFCN